MIQRTPWTSTPSFGANSQAAITGKQNRIDLSGGQGQAETVIDGQLGLLGFKLKRLLDLSFVEIDDFEAACDQILDLRRGEIA